jgi:hypothetical protein
VPRVIALTILAIIAAVAAFSADRSTSEFTRITLRKGTAPKPQMSDAEAQAKWDAIWGSSHNWTQTRHSITRGVKQRAFRMRSVHWPGGLGFGQALFALG